MCQAGTTFGVRTNEIPTHICSLPLPNKWCLPWKNFRKSFLANFSWKFLIMSLCISTFGQHIRSSDVIMMRKTACHWLLTKVVSDPFQCHWYSVCKFDEIEIFLKKVLCLPVFGDFTGEIAGIRQQHPRQILSWNELFVFQGFTLAIKCMPR